MSTKITHEEALIASGDCRGQKAERTLRGYVRQQQALEADTVSRAEHEAALENYRANRASWVEAMAKLEAQLTALQAEHERVVAQWKTKESEAWEFAKLRASERDTERARAGRLEGALTELVGWIKSNGRIENHGHRKPGASCVECQVVNAAEAALSTAPQASTEQASPSPAVGERRDCPECGPGCRFDEDGCCGTCGRDTVLVPAQPAPGGTERQAVKLCGSCEETVEDCAALRHGTCFGEPSLIGDPTPAEPQGRPEQARTKLANWCPACEKRQTTPPHHCGTCYATLVTQPAPEVLTEEMKSLGEGRPEQAGDRVDHASIGAGGGDEAYDDCPPDSRAITVYMSNDGSTLAFPRGAFTTVRACRHCGALLTGGPTACVHCVRLADRLEGK